MITDELFTWLLAQPEGPQIDFKRDPYRLQEEEGRADFIKDVLSMANTPRGNDSYIVLGVKAHSDGKKDLYGLTVSSDDNEYQSAVAPKVHPCPRFVYVPIQYQGKSYGVIEIRREHRGPFQATVDVGKKVRRYVIYWRRGTTNDEARSDEQELIRHWVRGGASIKQVSKFLTILQRHGSAYWLPPMRLSPTVYTFLSPGLFFMMRLSGPPDWPLFVGA